MKKRREEVDTCYICNGLNLVTRHFSEWMCNNCYHLIQRMKAKYKRDTGLEMSRDEFLTKAISRRAEIKETGKWEKGKPKDDPGLPNIRISILK